ncbi:MAG TPA: hypothetical protein VLT90_14730 [Terriglobales bacterium]|nr:hypothetical protein [Terriglobales bacterium]
MNRSFFMPLAIAAFAALSVAQTTGEATAATPVSGATSTQASTQPQTRVPAGTTIVAELSKSLDAKKAKPGDKVEARTSMDLLSQGKVIIPRNTKITGRVTEVKAHSKDSPDSRLGITFDRIAMKDGSELQMQAGLQAIGRPLQLAVPSPEDDPMSSMPSASMPSGAGMGGGAHVPTPSGPDSPATAAPTASQAALSSKSRGVVGIKGLDLKSVGATSVISAEKENVHLDSGTQLILKAE